MAEVGCDDENCWGVADEEIDDTFSMLASDCINKPRVFSWSGVALPAAASWSRLDNIGFADAAALTWLIRFGVIAATCVVRDDIKGVGTLSAEALGVGVKDDVESVAGVATGLFAGCAACVAADAYRYEEV